MFSSPIGARKFKKFKFEFEFNVIHITSHDIHTYRYGQLFIDHFVSIGHVHQQVNFSQKTMGTLEKCFPEDVKKVEVTTPIVILSHYDLTDVNSSLKEKISTAFGSDGLGILFVRDVPGYVSARSRLLPLARKFTELDPIIQVIQS